MEVRCASRDLAKILADERELKRVYNKRAKAIKLRLTQLRAAATLDDMRAFGGQIEALKHNLRGQFSLRINANLRMIFVPDHDPIPTLPDGSSIDWTAVTRITIIKTEEDYHS